MVVCLVQLNPLAADSALPTAQDWGSSSVETTVLSLDLVTAQDWEPNSVETTVLSLDLVRA